MGTVRGKARDQRRDKCLASAYEREGKQRMLCDIFIALFTVYGVLFFLITQHSRSTASSRTTGQKIFTSVKWWDTIQRNTQKINKSNSERRILKVCCMKIKFAAEIQIKSFFSRPKCIFCLRSRLYCWRCWSVNPYCSEKPRAGFVCAHLELF